MTIWVNLWGAGAATVRTQWCNLEELDGGRGKRLRCQIQFIIHGEQVRLINVFYGSGGAFRVLEDWHWPNATKTWMTNGGWSTITSKQWLCCCLTPTGDKPENPLPGELLPAPAQPTSHQAPVISLVPSLFHLAATRFPDHAFLQRSLFTLALLLVPGRVFFPAPFH